MVAAMVTIRPELEKLVAFSEATRTNVSQLVVTGPGAPPIAAVDDLAGQQVFVRKASVLRDPHTAERAAASAWETALIIDLAPDVLEDDDLLEMVNAGLAPITVVDDYLAEFWKQVLTNITVHRDVPLRSGGRLAVAFRKESPELRNAVNVWLRKHGEGDAERNMVERRYLRSVKREERCGRRRASEVRRGHRALQESTAPNTTSITSSWRRRAIRNRRWTIAPRAAPGPSA